MKKPPHKGWNVYRNDKFWLTINSKTEDECIEWIVQYVKSNRFNIASFSYRRFENHKHKGDIMKISKINT